MNKTFDNLDPSKQQRIIDACIEEFAIHGYRQASTNHMTKSAGISKGLLFHYFGSKQQLYVYLFQHVSKEFVEQFLERMQQQSADLLERILQWTIIKLDLFRSNPLVYQFAFSSICDDLPSEVRNALQALQTNITGEMTQRLLDGIEWSLFRQDVDKQQAVQFIVAALDSHAQHYIRLYKQAPDHGLGCMDQVEAELRVAIDFVRHGVYR